MLREKIEVCKEECCQPACITDISPAVTDSCDQSELFYGYWSLNLHLPTHGGKAQRLMLFTLIYSIRKRMNRYITEKERQTGGTGVSLM